MTAAAFLAIAIDVSLAMLIASFLIIVARLILGPTLPDRILALDMLVTVGIGFIAVITVLTGFDEYLDVAISLGLVGFLATAAFARYVMQRALRPGVPDELNADPESSRRNGAKA